MSGGLIMIQSIFENLIQFIFTTEIMNGFTLGWAIIYILLLSIILGLAFNG